MCPLQPVLPPLPSDYWDGLLGDPDQDKWMLTEIEQMRLLCGCLGNKIVFDDWRNFVEMEHLCEDDRK